MVTIPGMQHPRTLHLDTERTWRGGEQQAHYLATGLAARGCDVAVAGHRAARSPSARDRPA